MADNWYPGKNIWDWISGWGGDDDEGFTEETWADTGIGSLEDLDTMFPTTDVDWNSILGEAWGYDDDDIDISWGDESTPETGILGGQLGPWLSDTFLGDDEDAGVIAQILGGLLGGGQPGQPGQPGSGGGLLGGGGLGTLGTLLLANYLSKKDEGPADIIPMGQQAYGSPDVYGQPIDYRVTNLQPALMPGVAYANVAQPETPPVPMRHGGIASLASREGPGDITLAKLEPGEFVMTKKATDNIGAQNLYRMMKQAEGGG